jgi:hypothetical protein
MLLNGVLSQRLREEQNVVFFYRCQCINKKSPDLLQTSSLTINTAASSYYVLLYQLIHSPQSQMQLSITI